MILLIHIIIIIGQFKKWSVDYYGAIEDSSKAIELRAQDTNDLAEHYYGRGTHYYAIQDLKGACLDWEKASQLRNRNAKTDFKKYCNSFIKIHER